MNSEIIGEIYNQYYSLADDDGGDYSLNSIGWNSSFTEEPYSEAEMYEWRNNTIDIIRSFSAKRVLEIACGTGMMMFSILKDINYYLGIDVAEEGIKYIKSHLSDDEKKKTDFYVMSAENIDELEQDGFDLAFINSATQYMGPEEEFRECVVKMINKVAKGGKIFLGDMKSKTMQDKFYTLTSKWNGDNENADETIAMKKKMDFEYYIDKSFFDSLMSEPRVKKIELLLKKGKMLTEMNLFRFEAVIYLDEYEEKEFFHVDCEGMDLVKLGAVFEENKDKEYIMLEHISNKLMNDVFAEKLGDKLRASLYINDVCELAERYGFRTSVLPSNNESAEFFDIKAFK